jgi:hypothetical protein
LIRKGKSPAKQQLKARILLQADECPAGAKWSDRQISEALGTYPVMCTRVRRQWVEGRVGAVSTASGDAARSTHLRWRERSQAHSLSAFVAAKEDMLAIYKRPRDLDLLLVCLDETSKQLLANTRASIPMKPGQPERRDYEYERNGTS